MRHQVIVALIPALITVAVFLRVTSYGFVNFDDNIHVYENPYIVDPTGPNLKHLLQTPHQQLYIPASYSLWWLQSKLSSRLFAGHSGSSLDPRVFHTGNLILHAFSVTIVFLLLNRLIGSRWAAVAGALLFGLHPLQVEAVAWISEMKGLLSGGFGLLAIWLYTTYGADTIENNRTSNIRYLFATVCFALAMLSKPSAVVAPIVAGVISYWLLRRPARRTVLELAPWLVIAAPLVVLTKIVQPDAAQEFLPALWQRSIIAGDALSFYFYKLVLPVSLGIDYGRTPAAVLGNQWAYITASIPYGLLTLLLWKCRRPWVLTPVLVFVIALTPVLGLVTFDFQHISTVADRYLYLAMLGPALGAAKLFAHSQSRIVRGIVVTAIMGLALTSLQQVHHWRTSESLFRHALQINDNSWLAHHSLGLNLRKSGKLGEAIDHYKEAIRLRPNYAKAHMNMGVALMVAGNIPQAVNHLEESLRINPRNADAHVNLGVALVTSGEPEKALPHFRSAVQLQPDSVNAHYNLGNALYLQQDLAGAMTAYRKTLEIDPDFQPARTTLLRLQQDYNR